MGKIVSFYNELVLMPSLIHSCFPPHFLVSLNSRMQRLCVIAFVGCYRTSFNRLELYPLILIAPNVGNSLDEIVSHFELNTLTGLLDKEINTIIYFSLYVSM